MSIDTSLVCILMVCRAHQWWSLAVLLGLHENSTFLCWVLGICKAVHACFRTDMVSSRHAVHHVQAVKEVAPALQKLMHLQDLTIVGDAYFQMSADCAAVVAASLRCLTALLRFTMTCCRCSL